MCSLFYCLKTISELGIEVSSTTPKSRAPSARVTSGIRRGPSHTGAGGQTSVTMTSTPRHVTGKVPLLCNTGGIFEALEGHQVNIQWRVDQYQLNTFVSIPNKQQCQTYRLLSHGLLYRLIDPQRSYIYTYLFFVRKCLSVKIKVVIHAYCIASLQTSLQSLEGTIAAASFADDLKKWHKQLQTIEAVLSVWLKVQLLWVQLEEVGTQQQLIHS